MKLALDELVERGGINSYNRPESNYHPAQRYKPDGLDNWLQEL
jgi:hypothetical protein